MKKTITILALGVLCSGSSLWAQISNAKPKTASPTTSSSVVEPSSKPQKLKVSGYLQVQGQWGQEQAQLRVGKASMPSEGESIARVGVRRGRIKLTYQEGVPQGVFQVDITEKGVGVKMPTCHYNPLGLFWDRVPLE